jgi:transcriptional regulator with XRE-family HTH domain
MRRCEEGRAEGGSGGDTLSALAAVTVGKVSDNELGMFLRRRREALAPATAGLPAGPRRRTSGLRRAEVAMLAGVSVEYLIRLEQGRDRRPSIQVLSALADALQLGLSERTRLYYLAKSADTGFNCKGPTPPGREVRPTMRALLGQLEPAPAMLVNRVSDILACTDGYRRLAEPIGLLDGTPPNLARYVFTDPRARSAYSHWDHIADEHCAWPTKPSNSPTTTSGWSSTCPPTRRHPPRSADSAVGRHARWAWCPVDRESHRPFRIMILGCRSGLSSDPLYLWRRFALYAVLCALALMC